jgi:hypothetical protein
MCAQFCTIPKDSHHFTKKEAIQKNRKSIVELDDIFQNIKNKLYSTVEVKEDGLILYVIRLYNTDIMTIIIDIDDFISGVVLNTGGFRTVTTFVALSNLLDELFDITFEGYPSSSPWYFYNRYTKDSLCLEKDERFLVFQTDLDQTIAIVQKCLIVMRKENAQMKIFKNENRSLSPSDSPSDSLSLYSHSVCAYDDIPVNEFSCEPTKLYYPFSSSFPVFDNKIGYCV